MLKMLHLGRIVLASSLIVAPASALAASQVTITRVSNNVWVVTGNLQGVAGIQAAISYDPKVLGNPRISTGSLVGGMTVVTNPPSSATTSSVNPVQIAAVGVSGVTSSGTIATITFDQVGATSKRPITEMTTYAIDPTGARVAVETSVIDNGEASPSTDASGTPGASTTTATNGSTPITTNAAGTGTPTPTGSGGAYVVGGTVTLPSAEVPEREARNAAPSAPPSDSNAAPDLSAKVSAEEKAAPRPAAAETASQAGAPAAPVTTPKPVQSVLERFRLFAGDKTVKNLAALFAADDNAPFTQSPAIAIADGKATVKVAIHQSAGDKAPTFSFRGAHFVSLAQNADGEWEVVVRPDADVVAASVTMFTKGGASQEMPLTVAPKADVAEGDVVRLLNERGTVAAPKHDLNRDGRRDYIDDYILVANYLVRMKEADAHGAASSTK